MGTGGADASLSRSGAARSATRSAALTPRDRDWRCPMRPPGGAVTTRRCCPDPHRAAPGPRVAAEVRLSLGEPRGSARLPFSRGAAEGGGGGLGGWAPGVPPQGFTGTAGRRWSQFRVGPGCPLSPGAGLQQEEVSACSRSGLLLMLLHSSCVQQAVAASHLSPRSARRLCADPQPRG